MHRAATVVLALATGCIVHRVASLIATGGVRELRQRPAGARPSSPGSPPVLFLAFDGVSRDLLYGMLRRGELPNLAALLGGDGFAHAYFDDSLLSTLPSSTMAAWVTALTGETPAEHGVTANEYFVRETRTLAVPAPVSFADAAPTLSIYTDGYLDSLVDGRTAYERMRERDPDMLIWVVMSHVYRGADQLLMARRTVLMRAFEGFAEDQIRLDRKPRPTLYAELDRAAIEVLNEKLGSGPVPDVLTVYLSGTDLYAHIAEEGPDKARHDYLREVVDPALGTMVRVLRMRGALDGRWVMITADHGHTQVMHDDQHAVGTGSGDGVLPVVLRRVGFRVRPAQRDVAATDPFSAVICDGGAMAYVYLADRSTCPGKQDVCDWNAPPRFDEDVVPAAEAIYQNNLDGVFAPRLRGAIDLILTRRPRPFAEDDAPFEVYVGGGKTVPVPAYLADHPHPTYVAVDERLRDLAAGRHGERAGDILLIAHDGDRDRPADRFYFASLYRSWHGSPSRLDSEIPLIVANSRLRRADIAPWVQHILGDRPYQQHITDLLLGMREAPPR